MKHRRLRDENGSLVMTLLAVIILGGVIAALYTSVQTSTTSVRGDRDFHQAVQVADAGIQQAFVSFRELPEGAEPACDTAAQDPVSPGNGRCSGSIAEGSYEWSYEHLGGVRWRIVSEGTYRGASRTLEAELGPQQLFDVAILAKQWLTYNGGGGGPSGGPFPVGSFGTITANGGAVNHLSGIVLYGSGPHSFPSGFANVTSGGEPPLPNIAAQAFGEDGACETGPQGSYPSDFAAPQVRGQVYCASTINFGNGIHPLIGPTEDGPVTIYVDASGAEALAIEGSGRANFSEADPDASDLIVYVAGGDVQVSGNAYLAAAIWAPNSSCTSNGGTIFKGAMVCNTATLNGNFDFADDVDGITDGEFTVNNWQERVATAGLG